MNKAFIICLIPYWLYMHSILLSSNPVACSIHWITSVESSDVGFQEFMKCDTFLSNRKQNIAVHGSNAGNMFT
ncbi:hypothetical protein L1887_03547 [Cichorium endivia]|nr:hypothetical protein L1887_03547 [Cichorium endivia]